jgi:hypothetical protein
MNPQSSRLRHQQKEQTVQAQQTQQKVEGREFASAEEMLRHDAAQTPVPEAVKSRLAESIEKEPRPAASTSWWRRMFGGGGPQ